MSIIKLTDQSELVSTKSFPSYAHFPFQNFNPVQSRAFEIFDKNCNIIIAASTSAGKTVIAEMIASHEIRAKHKKVVYLAPLKALAKEKLDDWSSEGHHFGDLKITICTGDYQLTPSRKKELDSADLIVMTTEMMNSRCRNADSEQSEFLKELGAVICDEFHLLTVPGRGDHLEVGMMKLTQINPNVRIVGLSATMPNMTEIAEWVSNLNNKETCLISSTFRPCPLGKHYETYCTASTYEATEEEKVMGALQIIEDYRDDKFLVFAHTKRTGEMMKKKLLENGFQCEFHNADLEKEKRHDLENRFRNGKLQIIVATSGLAWGLNLPARRVIILGVHRGLSLVEDYDISQMIGRSGRPGYDPRGDAYILVPEEQALEHQDRLDNPKPITSRLLDHIGEDNPKLDKFAHYKTLAFHLIGEIHHGNVKNREEIHNWYNRSLAHFQAQSLKDSIIDHTLDLLVDYHILKIEGDEYTANVLGIISSMFYYSPFDVADLKRNFNQLFAKGLENNDLVASMCLANIDTLKMGIVSKIEKTEMAEYALNVSKVFGMGKFTDAAIKGGYAYYCLMNGKDLGALATTGRMLQMDYARLNQVLNAIDGMSGKWNKKEYLKNLHTRVLYGVREELVNLVGVADVGKVRAEKLWSAGIKDAKTIAATSVERLSKVLNLTPERVKKIKESAQSI